MSKPKIAIVVGSTRAARFADVPTQWIAKIAKSHADIDVEVVDLRDFPMPFFDEVASSAWVPSTNEVAQRWQKKVAEFDGFIFTAAEYNHGPTAVLKNAIDWLSRMEQEAGRFRRLWQRRRRPRGRCLRLHAVELQMAPVKSAVHIAWGDFLAVRQGEKKLEDLDHLNQAATALVNDVAWWAKALKKARAADVLAEEVQAA